MSSLAASLPARTGRPVLPALALLAALGCGGSSPSHAPGQDTPDPSAPPLTQVAFGSCSDEDQPQPLWTPILATRPQLWIWLGDNIYGDTPDTAVMRAKYARQDADTGYQRLRGTVPIIGTWDDHDFGVNNGGREWAAKEPMRRLALDFLGEPQGTARRARAGLWEAYTYGPPGKRVKVLLLDTRYHRDPLPPAGETSTGDVLGAEQWTWLERELTSGGAQVHVIVSSIQVLPEQQRFEKWGNFPAARERLVALVARTRAPGVFFVSGDRHFAELSRLDDARVGYPLYDLTSSGMTHSFATGPGEANALRVGAGFGGLNFGTMSFDWTKSPVEITLQVRDAQNVVRIEQRFPAGQPITR